LPFGAAHRDAQKSVSGAITGVDTRFNFWFLLSICDLSFGRPQKWGFAHRVGQVSEPKNSHRNGQSFKTHTLLASLLQRQSADSLTR